MIRQDRRFPLVADNELLVGEIPMMSLYDESDLISNIRGPYQDKDFTSAGTPVITVQSSRTSHTEEELLPPLFEAKPSHYSRKNRQQQMLKAKSSVAKTQGQIAREQAREDLKKKRSASYLRDEKVTIHPSQTRPIIATPDIGNGKTVDKLTRLANNLRQTDYILADMPMVYSLKKEDREQEQAVKKNSYDFLRKSQVYNYPERAVQRERQLAQELNLTHIEEERNV
ncbi:TPA: hypothetical protein ACGO0M_000233 [Streptococcus suis]|nr:hypothetical protein [Streptococcus suis]NQN90559.1 hypothetical protein [Streptococcus suis]NQP58560.1 hypothetical protein [Streptococcus suis]HEL1557943.1 hypothetical protein [Streptococcus suis]HEM6271309.1 hypothetical protein [Streptococcus suis]